MDLLDPKLDVVFKLLFADPRNEALLISLIEAVLRPPSPIEAVTVLDPEIPKEDVEDKGIFLDVLVELRDGTRVDLEMQCDARGALPDRWLYNWARLFGGGIGRGDHYSALRPVVCIVFLDANIGARFHSVKRLRDDHDQSVFTHAISIHLIELPRLPEATSDEGDALLRWARFLRVRDRAELQSLAHEDPVMAQAKDALERLSDDPQAKALAEKRERSRINLALIEQHARELAEAEGREKGLAEGLAEGRAEGRAEGLAEGRAEGRAEGLAEGQRRVLREWITFMCAQSGIEVDASRRAELESGSAERLEQIVASLRSGSGWPVER